MTNGSVLTEMDRRLIAILQRDARLPNTALARELGTTESTVRRRIEWLTSNGYIRCVAVTDPHKLGYSVWVLVQLKTNLPDVESVATALSEFSVVSYVAVTTGAFDVLFTAHFHSPDELYQFLTKEISKIKGITNVQTSMILGLTKRSFEYGVPIADGDNVNLVRIRDKENDNEEMEHAQLI